MRLLIVDDSPTMRAILRTYAQDMAFETTEAADGREALVKLLTAGPFDAALIDWDMPGMNGLDLTRAIRGDSQCRSLKILMVTAQNTLEGVRQALAAGADDYLMKPIDEPMFVEKLCLLGLAS